MSEHSGTNNVHTRRMADFVAQLSCERIPEEVRERVKLLILDSLGCGLYGANLPWCRILQDTFGGLDASRTTSVWGTGQKLSSPHAALVNGTQVQGFELDDVHRDGMLDVFEAPYGGFCTTFSRSQDRFNLDALSAGLGSEWETMRVALKFYSCVGSNHTTLDAIRDIRQRRPFTLDELDRIVVHGSQVTVDHVGWPYRPEGLTSAQLNLPYCVATLLLEGDVFVDQFTEAAVPDQARREP